MTSTLTKPSTEMIRALYEAKYFCDLMERDGEIYSWRSSLPICSKGAVLALVERGWLKPCRSSYRITNAGKSANREL